MVLLILLGMYSLVCYTTNRRALTMGALNSHQPARWRWRMAVDFLFSPLTAPFKMFF